MAFLLLFFYTNIGFCQTPTIEWQKSLGGSEADRVSGIQQTSDGGYIVAGYTSSNDGDVIGNHSGYYDFWIIKLDAAGNIQWKKSLGGSYDEYAYSIQQTSDGGYMVAGVTSSNDGDVIGGHNGLSDCWIVKLDATGDIQWQKSLGGTGDERAVSVQQTADGYIIAGISASNDGDVSGNHGAIDCWVVKLDAAGTILWQKCLGGSNTDKSAFIQQTNDGGYIFGGISRSSDGNVSINHGDYDYWIVKLDATGNIQWQKSLGGSGTDMLTSIQQTGDGGYIVGGSSTSTDGDVTGNHGGNDYWVVKLDAGGNTEWQKSLGGSNTEQANSILQTTDGGYVVAGISRSNDGDVTGNHGSDDQWVVKLDEAGNIKWQKCLGGSGGDDLRSIQQTIDGGYILGGASGSNDGDVSGNHGNADYWIVKLCDLPPKPGNITGSISPCEDVATTYSISTLNGVASYTWTVPSGWVIVSGHGTNSISVTPGRNAGNIMVMANNGCGSSPAQTLAVTVTSSVTPAVNIISTSTAICSGSSITFTATPTSGGAAPVYQWKKNNTNIGTNSATYTDASLNNNDIITCELTTSETCVTSPTATSNAITIVVSSKVKPAINITSTSTSICSGSSITFTATPTSGGAAPVYQWKKNNTNIGTNSATYTDASLNNNDIITCELTSSENCVTSATAISNAITIVVSSKVTPAINITSTSTTICSGASITFTATATNGGAAPVYQWKKNNTNIGTNSATYTDASLNNNDIITCELTSSENCVTSATAISNAITIVVSSKVTPAINITSTSTTICSGASITFTATATNGGAAPAYQWKKNSTNVGTNSATYADASLNDNDIITCELTTSETCVTSPTATYNAITIVVSSKVTPAINITSTSTSICFGSSITFTATATNGGAAPAYQWKKNSTNVGTNSATYADASLNDNDIITCELTTSETCVTSPTATSNAITITTGTLVTPSINITSTSTTICSGASITFTATITNGGAAPAYQWKKNSTNVGTNSATYNDASLNDADVVNCELTSSENCVTSATAISNTININSNATLVPTINIKSTSTTICDGSIVTFTATAANGGASPVYEWKKNGITVGANSTTYTDASLNNNDIVTCKLTSSETCVSSTAASSNAITIAINTLPVIFIAPGDTVVMTGKQVQLHAMVNGSIISYEWLPSADFINASTLSPVTVPITKTTAYWLNVKSEDGCPVNKKITIGVYNNLFIPNSFTPNGDGLNDVFRIPPNVPLQLKDFTVYNRWGQKVFFTSNINKGWDGINHPTGAYVYVISGTNDKKTVFLKGTVMLIR